MSLNSLHPCFKANKNPLLSMISSVCHEKKTFVILSFLFIFLSWLKVKGQQQCKCDWCCEALIEDIEVIELMTQGWCVSDCWPIGALPRHRKTNQEWDQWDTWHLQRRGERGWCDGDNRILIESSVMRQQRPGSDHTLPATGQCHTPVKEK